MMPSRLATSHKVVRIVLAALAALAFGVVFPARAHAAQIYGTFFGSNAPFFGLDEANIANTWSVGSGSPGDFHVARQNNGSGGTDNARGVVTVRSAWGTSVSPRPVTVYGAVVSLYTVTDAPCIARVALQNGQNYFTTSPTGNYVEQVFTVDGSPIELFVPAVAPWTVTSGDIRFSLARRADQASPCNTNGDMRGAVIDELTVASTGGTIFSALSTNAGATFWTSTNRVPYFRLVGLYDEEPAATIVSPIVTDMGPPYPVITSTAFATRPLVARTNILASSPNAECRVSIYADGDNSQPPVMLVYLRDLAANSDGTVICSGTTSLPLAPGLYGASVASRADPSLPWSSESAALAAFTVVAVVETDATVSAQSVWDNLPPVPTPPDCGLGIVEAVACIGAYIGYGLELVLWLVGFPDLSNVASAYLGAFTLLVTSSFPFNVFPLALDALAAASPVCPLPNFGATFAGNSIPDVGGPLCTALASVGTAINANAPLVNSLSMLIRLYFWLWVFGIYERIIKGND